MKPRHAAALALVGWYVMVPPPVIHSSVPVNLGAPLSEWGIFSAHDRQPNVSKPWSHSTNLQRQNWSQTLLTRGTEYDFTSLRALSASPATTRASRKNSAPFS